MCPERILRKDADMEQMKNKDEQRLLTDEADYIDIPAFIRSMLRYARRYILLVVPLIICMTAALSVLTKPYAKKYYVAGGTAMVGVRLSGSLSFDYNLSSLSWDRQATMAHMSTVMNALLESGYLNQCVKDYIGLQRDEALNGQIYFSAAYATNLIDISVASESQEDAQTIRDAAFACFPDAVYPAVGSIELDALEMYTREEASPRAFLDSPKVWAAGGVVLGIIGYLGLIFLYTLRRRDVETPGDISKLTDLPCIGRLPRLKKKKEYQQAFRQFRRTAAEEIREHQIKVILLTGIGSRKGQSTIAAELEKDWAGMGKKVVLADLSHKKGPMTEEKVYYYMDNCLEEADIILIDGPSCDASADALVMADCADAMIIVIPEGTLQPDELKEMFESLQYVNARPLGYVLNMCSNV